jgi:cation transporter-like permease
METVMMPVVMRRRGLLGSLFAKRTAAKTTTTWMI